MIQVEDPNEVQAAPLENGYSIAIIALAVVLLESAINRIQYVKEKDFSPKALDYIKRKFNKETASFNIEEVFVIRDVIVHSHSWKIQYLYDESWNMKPLSFQLLKGFGDNKFKKVLNEKTKTTKLLNLHLVPTRICKTDAVVVLRMIINFLLSIEKINPNYFRVSAQLVKYKGSLVKFVEIINNY